MLTNFWYAVLASAELKNAARRVVLGRQSYAVFRDSGAVRAVADLCPHQGASLSGGQVKDGCIVCPYHAWHFTGDGKCFLKPSDPDSIIRERDHVPFQPVLEQDGFIWLFYGEPSAADSIKPPLLITENDDDDDGFRAVNGVFKFNAHLDRVMLNGTDIAHVPFVHASQFGNALQPATPLYQLQIHKGGASAALASVAPSTPAQLLISKVAFNGEMFAVARAYFFMPNITALQVTRGGKTVLLVSAHVPIGEDQNAHQTESHWVIKRNFLRCALFDAPIRRSMDEVFKADASIISEQRPQALTLGVLRSGANAQLSDRLGIYYRKLLREALQEQSKGLYL